MQIEISIIDGTAIVTLSGRVEPGTGDDVKAAFDRLLDDGHRDIVVNLERATSIDTAVLGAIVRAYSEVSRRGGRLRIEGVNERIRELLGLNLFTGLFDPGTSVQPFPNPFNPRLDDEYRKAAMAVASLILLTVVVAMIIWALR